MSSATVFAPQYDAHGKQIRTAEVWVNRATLRGRPDGNVGLIITLGKRNIHLSISPDDWYKLNQAAWAANPGQSDGWEPSSVFWGSDAEQSGT